MFINLLKIEFRKHYTSSGFWILIALHSLVILLIVSNLSAFLSNARLVVNDIPDLNLSFQPILQFPDVWQNVTYIAGYFKIILALILISSVSNEFAQSTLRQNIIDGMSRREWIFSKIGLAKILALYSTLMAGGLCLYFGFSGSQDNHVTDFWTGFLYLPSYFLELLTYFIYALFLTLLLKKTGISLILLLLYDLILEPILSWSIPEYLRPFLPMNVIDNMNKFPFTKYVNMDVSQPISYELIFIAVIYAGIFTFLSYLVLKNKNL